MFTRSTSRAAPAIASSGTNTGASYSPNGRELAVIMSKDGNPELYTTSASGSGAHRLTRTPGVESSPTWSPSGDEIIYSSDDRGGPQLFRISSGGGSGRLISTGLQASAFGLGVTGPGLLVVLAVEGNMLRCVMETYDAAHRWSAPLSVAFPGQELAPDVEKVITQTRGENLFIGFIIRLRNGDGSVSRYLWEAVWAGTGPVLATAPVTLARGHAFWQDQLASPGMEMN